MFSLDAEFLIALAVSIYLTIVFLQSGLDKAFDFSGNLAFLSEMFESAPIKLPVAPLLACVTLFEVAAGCLLYTSPSPRDRT